MQSRAEVVVVGGGATGTGIARDLTMRGVDVTLVERDRLAFGTSGRMHGLLHSGARYAVSGPDTARHCHDENRTLRDIAAHCVEETGGLFVQLPDDDAEYFDRKLRACQEAGIPVEEIDPDRARREEPLLSDDVERALRVPDAAIDPFGLIAANAASAADHGATIRTHTAVTDVLVEDGTVVGVAIDDDAVAGRSTIRAEQVVNAAGPWAGELAAMAGVDVPMRPAKGAMVVTNIRHVDTVINHCRPRTEADILVPHGTTAILGTTDREIEDPDDYEEESWEVTHLIEELSKLVPELTEARPLRAYWGVRPLFAPEGQEDTVPDSRDFAILNHQKRDSVGGFTTVVGGKLTLYRLMAERVADLIADRLGVDAPCRTASEPLPGSDGAVDVRTVMQRFDLRSQVAHRTADRLGNRTDPVLEGSESADRRVLCECEAVTRAEVRDAIDAVGPDIEAIRNRTRASMGTCQGTRCGHRLASEIARVHGPEASMDALEDLTVERWRGQRHVAEGRLGQLALTYSVHGGTYNRSRDPEAFRVVNYDAFGGGDGGDT